MKPYQKFTQACERFIIYEGITPVGRSVFIESLKEDEVSTELILFFKNSTWPAAGGQSNHGAVFGFSRILDEAVDFNLWKSLLLPIGLGCNGDIIAVSFSGTDVGWLPMGQIAGVSAEEIGNLFCSEAASIGEFFWNAEFKFPSVSKDWSECMNMKATDFPEK